MHGLPFHYGWVIVFTGMLALLSCLGLARFSFGMLLPSMSESLQLTYGERGYLSSGYLIGYLLMVALVSLVNSRLGSRLTITIGLLLIAASMISVGFARSFISVLFQQYMFETFIHPERTKQRLTHLSYCNVMENTIVMRGDS